MRRLMESKRLVNYDDPRTSMSRDIITVEDLMEARHPVEFDADLAEWGFRVIKTGGNLRKELGILFLRLRANGDIVLRLK